MALLKPDPTFYTSPGEAQQAPAETLAYVVTLNTGSNGDSAPDALSVLDLEKAQDGRVGAQIRIVIGGQPRDRKRKGEEAPKEDPKKGSDVLDRLGY